MRGEGKVHAQIASTDTASGTQNHIVETAEQEKMMEKVPEKFQDSAEITKLFTDAARGELILSMSSRCSCRICLLLWWKGILCLVGIVDRP